MPPRTSARGSVTRDQASSPPKQSSERQSQSPVRRSTRSTRSQSVELGENENATATKRGGRRGVRHGSAESVESNASASSRGGRTRKATRAIAAAANRDLSIVAEDREEQSEEEEEGIEQGGIETQRSLSPGAMSGTTFAFSVKSTHSAQELADLDPMMVENLPDLFANSRKILNLLAPVDASEETVESIIRELKVLGSHRAKRLRNFEAKFATDRENFGSDHFIRAAFILRKLLGGSDPEEVNSRPDAILHTANLATVIKDFLVTQKESQAMHEKLTTLDMYFPEAFITKFVKPGERAEFGKSDLLDDTFVMAKEIRTQFTIVNLSHHKESQNWDPEQILAQTWYGPVDKPDPSLSVFDDAVKNARLEDLIRMSPNDPGQAEEITERIELIHSTFRQNNHAIEAGDLVDFEQLDELFPWTKFLTGFVQWSRARLAEIDQSIVQQGGLENITRSLIELVQSMNSQGELIYDPLPAIMESRQLLPPANIARNAPSQSFYSKRTVRSLEKWKRPGSSLEGPPSKQQKTVATSSRSREEAVASSSKPRERPEQSSSPFRPAMDDEEDDAAQETRQRPTSEYVHAWDEFSNEKNKENRPLNEEAKPSAKRSMLDRQANAERLKWTDDSQDNVPASSNRKHSRQEREESEESQDEGFQDDQRAPDPARRKAAPPARARAPVREVSPPKRARVQDRAATPSIEESESERRNQEAALQASASRGAFDDEDDTMEEEEDEQPAPTQIGVLAKVGGVRMRMGTGETQKRRPWADEDSRRLIDLIEEYGCSWAQIAKMPGWIDRRDNFQVQLKDKARNLKVMYLKAGMPLPINFDQVALGKKEIAAVRKVHPDYEP